MPNTHPLKEKADELFGKANYESFEIEDKFNNGNLLKGFISRQATNLYGALLITHINNEDAPQLIYGTPKMHYPFDKQGKWNFPKAKEIMLYEKLDGTNILAFVYKDIKGEEYLSFKTRLTPSVSDGRWGYFESMLREMINKYPNLLKLNWVNKCNISYELFGARNKHLLIYDKPLEMNVLFGITSGGNIIPPDKLDTRDIPVVHLAGTINSQFVEQYKFHQMNMNCDLKETEHGYRGQEGQVWYLHLENNQWTQMKCKPEMIEAIHFASGGINRNSIITTCINAFENYDDIDYEKVKQLLIEEFSEQDIEAHYYLILKCIDNVKDEIKFRERVLKEYRKIGKDVYLFKAEVMRELSQYFDKRQMSHVYWIIKNS